MNVLKFLFFALLLSPVCLPAQSAEMRFGEVPVEDWKVEDCPWDTIPGALILGDQGHIRVYIESGKGYMQAFKRHVRIKILDEKAYDFANITIPYYSKEGKESVRDIKAHTLLPGNIKRPVNPKDIFTEKINDNWSARKFTFPALQPGAILEYEYLLESEYVFSLDKWEFQHELPVRWSRLNVDFEANLSYAYIVEFPAVKQLSNNNRGQITYANGASSSFQGNTFIMRRLPGLREEAYMTTLNDYRSRIRFQLSEIIRSDGSKQPYLSTWEKVASDLLNDEVFGKRYLKKSNTKKLLETGLPQMAAAASQKEKVDAACRFIKSKVQDRGRRGDRKSVV